MCGVIAALSTSRPIDRQRFNQARDSMPHRGPDAAGSVFLQDGCVALGHRRLSILDLTAAANQPMQLDSLWITFNGEIYNYPELRRQLENKGCQFRTSCDTEVLLHGYQIWRDRLCEHLTGMFAFAIWDDQARQLFLARDHIGQKPLYYTEVGHHFVAASEIKAIKSLVDCRFEMRRESVLDNIIYYCVPEPNTWYQDIHCLLPGHQLVVRFNQTGFSSSITQYWTFSPDPDPPPLSQAEALDQMGQEIDRAVQSHLLADVEVGAFLSGGTDSGGIVARAARFVERPLKTFSIGFDSSGQDELPLARQTARQIGTEHHQGVVTEQDFAASVNRLLTIFDQPFADTSLVPTERVANLAARQVKVVLTGDGGDEIFGGYNYWWYVEPQLQWQSLRKLNVKGLKNFTKSFLDRSQYLLRGADHWHNSAPYFRRRYSTARALSLLGSDLVESIKDYNPQWVYYQYREPALDAFRQAQWFGLKYSLPSQMLVKVDRATMQHSLEARSPFLSHHLVETMLNMPTEVRNPKENWFKGLFRTWLADKVPPSVLNAPKRGFGTPLHWQPVNGNLQPEQAKLKYCIEASIVRPEAMPKIHHDPKIYWIFLQIERALREGLF